MFTQSGMFRIGDVFRSLLEGGTIVVGNGTEEESVTTTELSGDQQASAPIESVEAMGEFEEDEEPFRIVCKATFGPDQANFDWHERAIRLKDGTVLDRVVADQGRKVAGAIWAVEAELDLQP